jgi:hypothetical protein
MERRYPTGTMLDTTGDHTALAATIHLTRGGAMSRAVIFLFFTLCLAFPPVAADATNNCHEQKGVGGLASQSRPAPRR